MTNPPATNPLKQLQGFGQSVWLDFVRRNLLAEGGLKTLIDQDGVVGVTSNPSIFEKAIGESTDYDAQFKEELAGGDLDAIDLFEALAIRDIKSAANTLRPVYESTGGRDGYISLEVSPYLALKTNETIEEAQRLWRAVDRPNLMIKVPGTEQGVPAIRQLISEGINVNVTLLFARSAYEAVAEAYMDGLEALAADGGDVSKVASVASFFVSRIDSAIDGEIDRRLKAGEGDAAALKKVQGKVAIANAKLAFLFYQDMIASPRWKTLAAKGARPQRLLWASTGTKNPAYPDVLYVEELIGPDTVNTMPVATMDAYRDHGKPHTTLTADVGEAKSILSETERLGLDLDGVTAKLVADGVKLFADAFDKLLGAVEEKRAQFLGGGLDHTKRSVGEYEEAVVKTLDSWRREGKLRQLWARDPKLWTDTGEEKWLAWLSVVEDWKHLLPELKQFQANVRGGGFEHVLVIGMGGSSLGPEVLAETFGRQPGFPTLHVLDSTDPDQIRAFEKKLDLARTLCIVSSKSGSTLEPNILKQYFFERIKQTVGADKVGSRFVAVTDPGSQMQRVAEGDGFRKIFFGNPAIGGRYSVLSPFGIVPAAAMGLDLDKLLNDTAVMVRACDASVPPVDNPGATLGAVMGVLGNVGHDKVTIVASPPIYDIGAWLEQLIAESTGKIGKGLVPVDMEPLGAPEVYGDDRLFAYVRLEDGADPAQDKAIAALEAAGQPVVRIGIAGKQLIGQEFFRWEIATAVAGSILGINPFDQPDVEASKIKTRALTSEYETTGSLPAETPILTEDGISLYADPENAAALTKAAPTQTLDALMAVHVARLTAGDYCALLAYIERKPATIEALTRLRTRIRDQKRVATCVGFGPRFLHSTGQAYKGGPNSGVFLQITCDDPEDLAVPQQKYTFGVVKAAQARGDFEVLAERGRRALRVHLGRDLAAGLNRLAQAIERALA